VSGKKMHPLYRTMSLTIVQSSPVVPAAICSRFT
jgi:hypothetical protein